MSPAAELLDSPRFKLWASGVVIVTALGLCLMLGLRAVAHQRSVRGAALHAAGEPARAYPYLVNAARAGGLAGLNAAPLLELGEVAAWAAGDSQFALYHREISPPLATRLAFVCFARALIRRPSSTGALAGLADLFRRASQPGGLLAGEGERLAAEREVADRMVVALYDRAISLEPANYFWYAYLADYHREKGRDAEAMPLYAKAVTLMPDLGWHYYLGATGPMAPDLYDAARQGLERALTENEIFPREKIESNIGYLHERQRDYEAALEHYRRAVELAADPSQYLYQAALVLELQRRGEESEEYFRRALARGGLNERQELTALTRVGRLRLARGDATGAVEALTRARERDPGASAIRVDLGRALVASGQREKAEAELRQAIALDGSRPEGYVALIELSVSAGDFARAIPLARRLVELYPGDARYRAQLDGLYRRMGTTPPL